MYLALIKCHNFTLIGEQMTIEHNPLKQYFRRPSIYFKLPSAGIGYDPSVIVMTENGELPVYPMTAIDEITTKTPDALYNGTAVVEVIKSCVPNIKDPWRLTNVDLDAVLIAIKAAANGNELDIESACPKCSETSKYGVNLIGILSGLKSPDYDTELQVGDLHVKFKPLTYKEMNEVSTVQLDMQRTFAAFEAMTDLNEKAKKTQELLKSVVEMTMKALSKTIEHIRTPSAIVTEFDYIFDFIQSCDKGTYDIIKDHNGKLKEQSEIKPLKIKCVSCQHDYEQTFTLNMSDFFD
jgi:hypothetical protein